MADYPSLYIISFVRLGQCEIRVRCWLKRALRLLAERALTRGHVVGFV